MRYHQCLADFGKIILKKYFYTFKKVFHILFKVGIFNTFWLEILLLPKKLFQIQNSKYKIEIQNTQDYKRMFLKSISMICIAKEKYYARSISNIQAFAILPKSGVLYINIWWAHPLGSHRTFFNLSINNTMVCASVYIVANAVRLFAVWSDNQMIKFIRFDGWIFRWWALNECGTDVYGFFFGAW